METLTMRLAQKY